MKMPVFMKKNPTGSPCIMGDYMDTVFSNAYYVVYKNRPPVSYIGHIHGGSPPHNTSPRFIDPIEARMWIIDALIKMGNTDVLLMSVALGLK